MLKMENSETKFIIFLRVYFLHFFDLPFFCRLSESSTATRPCPLPPAETARKYEARRAAPKRELRKRLPRI